MHKSLSADNNPIGRTKYQVYLGPYIKSLSADNSPIGWTKRLKFFEKEVKQAADEEFIGSAWFGWPILHADESGWPPLSLGCLHRQNLPLASASSSCAAHCERGHLFLAEDS